MWGNWSDIVLDEIALEGLDGLTLEGKIKMDNIKVVAF